jgi:hypothetical protein
MACYSPVSNAGWWESAAFLDACRPTPIIENSSVDRPAHTAARDDGFDPVIRHKPRSCAPSWNGTASRNARRPTIGKSSFTSSTTPAAITQRFAHGTWQKGKKGKPDYFEPFGPLRPTHRPRIHFKHWAFPTIPSDLPLRPGRAGANGTNQPPGITRKVFRGG